MKKLFILCLVSILYSCNKDKELVSVKKVEFPIENDIYIEGFSDAENPFLFYAAGNDTIYKYYIDTNKTEKISLKEVTGLSFFSRYKILFKDEDFVVNQSQYVYNSQTKKLYNLDSLNTSNERHMYVLSNNNVNSWLNNKLLINNWPYCDEIRREQIADRKERHLLCNKIRQTKSSYSIIDFETNELKLSDITLKDIRPNPDYTFDLSSVVNYSTSIFVNDVILYNNHLINTVYEIDSTGKYKKAFTIDSKYTQFNTEDKLLLRPGYEDYARDYATRVKDIIFDKYRSKILVVLVHGTEDIEKYPEKKLSNRPFSILVYNNNYEFEHEYLFDEKYNYNNVYVCKEGLIINANNKLAASFKPRQLICEIFTY